LGDFFISPKLGNCSKLGAPFISNYLFDINAVGFDLKFHKSASILLRKIFRSINWKFFFICCTIAEAMFRRLFPEGRCSSWVSSPVWKVLSLVVLNAEAWLHLGAINRSIALDFWFDKMKRRFQSRRLRPKNPALGSKKVFLQGAGGSGGAPRGQSFQT
jgi:hypothetical protein